MAHFCDIAHSYGNYTVQNFTALKTLLLYTPVLKNVSNNTSDTSSNFTKTVDISLNNIKTVDKILNSITYKSILSSDKIKPCSKKSAKKSGNVFSNYL